MSSTQSQASTKPKPVLHGVKIKQRKGVKKANAKHEPEIFRDQLLAQLKTIEEGDFDAVSTKLDLLGNTLEYRKYGESLFEILILGGILEPGGIINRDAEQSPFYIFAAQDDAAVIKKYVDVFNKLIRRYKYLQRIFGETLENILSHINKWQPEENSKLAKSTGFFLCNDLAPCSVLKVLLQDYLVKDSRSLEFVTTVFRTVLNEKNIEQLDRILATERLNSRIIDFFPPNKRNEDCLVRHFEAEDMKTLVESYRINKKNDLMSKLTELFKNDSSTMDEAQEIIKNAELSEDDTIPFIWESILDSLDLVRNPDQSQKNVIHAITTWKGLLEAYCQKPKDELTLLQTIQKTCNDNATLKKSLRCIVEALYLNDILSEVGIIYWHGKSKNKINFSSDFESFVSKLNESDDESEDED